MPPASPPLSSRANGDLPAHSQGRVLGSSRGSPRLDNLRQRISTCTSQLAHFQVEVERLQKVCASLQSADNNTLHRLQPRRPIGSSGVEVLTERTLHIESCFDFLVRALQRHMPSVQWQCRREDS